MEERLQKVLARAGLGSRRQCDEMVAAGRVRVDGVVAQPGSRVGAQATITVDGRPLPQAEAAVYLMLHKPSGYVTTARDPQGRPTVLQLVSQVPERLFPVGRLDYDTEGLLLLTNDGDLAHALTHPRHEIDKEYVAEVAIEPDDRSLQRLRDGIQLEDGPTWPAQVERLAPRRLRLIIHEGRNRQVRRMLAAIDCAVKRLQRVRVGPLRLGSLPAGAWRRLTPRELERLRTACGMLTR
ncbi:MAG: pseudouridine synthase [Candidatus Xenobia bacterium]